MLRGTFKPDSQAGERYFRWRGGDVSRIEGLADAVFALALTFLVVRLQVPQTFAEVQTALGRAPVYVVCFALFLWVWYLHYQFHRRYGLEGPLTLTIDGAILFVVLMFSLPLRFLADTLYTRFSTGKNEVLGPDGEPLLDATGAALQSTTSGDAGTLMLLYSGGFTLLFALFILQTWNAARRADALELDDLERLITRHTMVSHVATCVVGLISCALAATGVGGSAAPGLVFFVMGPMHGLIGWRQGVAVHAKAKEMGLEPGG